jgi:LAS superfamily LD-carboxypeptidase LdcB
VTDSEPARTTTHPIRRFLVAGLLVVSATIPAAIAYQVPASLPSAPASSPTTARPISPPAAAPPTEVAPNSHRGPLGEADGVVPAGTTVFDDEMPGVANLDPALLGALRRAATDAADDGVEFIVNSGWRSPAYQKQLLREAVAKYGSEAKAARWVGTPKTSAHVSGDAVDLASSAATWLSEHGARYGLCQIYRNEPWHFELRSGAAARGCPRMYADPTGDPRMQP